MVALWDVALADPMETALAAGTRAVEAFAAMHGAVAVEFADPGAFLNVNHPEDLAFAQQMVRSEVERRRTARLLLRTPAELDLDFLVQLFQRPEMVAHRPDPTPDPPEDSARRLERDMAHWRDHGFGRWAAECNGRLVGFGGLTVREADDGLNISYHLHPDAWGHGYASEIVAEALAVAFGSLAASRVVGLVRPANPASRRVLERAGFAAQGEVELHGAPTVLLARYPA